MSTCGKVNKITHSVLNKLNDVANRYRSTCVSLQTLTNDGIVWKCGRAHSFVPTNSDHHLYIHIAQRYPNIRLPNPMSPARNSVRKWLDYEGSLWLTHQAEKSILQFDAGVSDRSTEQKKKLRRRKQMSYCYLNESTERNVQLKMVKFTECKSFNCHKWLHYLPSAVITPTTAVFARQSSISSIDNMFPLAKTGTDTFSLWTKQNKKKHHRRHRQGQKGLFINVFIHYVGSLSNIFQFSVHLIA